MNPQTARWLAMAEEDLAASRSLSARRLGNIVVFHLHLAVEKTLKAILIERRGERALILTHDLKTLTRACGLSLSQARSDFLDKLSPHGVFARYALASDGYSGVFCAEMRRGTRDVVEWLRQQLT